jgi:hypothetical protein
MKMPVQVLKKVVSIQREFLWGGVCLERKKLLKVVKTRRKGV